MEAFFSGERELFRGLYVDGVEWDWQTYPIMHLDLNNLVDLSFDHRYSEVCGITEKGYARPFVNDPRRLFKIGVNFSTETKLIDDWQVAG